jgi:hypothetical protein
MIAELSDRRRVLVSTPPWTDGLRTLYQKTRIRIEERGRRTVGRTTPMGDERWQR